MMSPRNSPSLARRRSVGMRALVTTRIHNRNSPSLAQRGKVGMGALITTIFYLAATPYTHAAEAYPAKPIRVIVPFAAGGGTDILVRTLSQKLSENLGQQLLIDNRGGAGGAIGAELAAKAAPDGYTIMATTSGVVVVNPSLYKKLAYDPLKDFAPIAIIASLPNMLVVHPSLP